MPCPRAPSGVPCIDRPLTHFASPRGEKGGLAESGFEFPPGVSWSPDCRGLAAVSDIEERVIRVLAETQHIDPRKITPCSTFDELGIDSFDGINVLFAIESEFDISVSDDEAKKLRGVGDTVQGVEKLLALQKPAAES